MATPQEIQQILAEIQRQYDRLGQTNPFKDFNTNNITDATTAIQQLEAGLRDVKNRVREVNSDMNGVVSAFRATIDEIKNQNSALTTSTKTLSGLQSIAQKLAYDQQGISKLNEKQLKSLQEQAKQRYADLKANKEALRLEIQKLQMEEADQDLIDKRVMALAAINGELEDEASNLGVINDRVAFRLEQEGKINESLGLGGAILGSMEGALNKLGMGGLAQKLGFSEAQEEMRALAERMEEGGELTGGFADKTKILKAGFKNMGANLLKNLKDPLSIGLMIVTQLVDALGKVDKLTGETAKNLGMSYKEANAMVSDMNDIANSSFDTHVNTENLVKAQLELSKALGTNVMLNKELLVDFAKLTEQAGYSVETMTALGKITQSTGGDLSDNTAEILGTAKAFNAVNKLALNEKDIVAEVAKTGAATVLTFGRSADALAKNVMQAKKFGLNLQQAESISSSLLNFQSSIESELEAELLTGKNLNLEQARFLALQGKTGEAAAEVAKQLGTAEEFGEMGVIQQEALAKAVGMSRDDLAQSLIEREALAKVGMQDLSTQEAYNKLKKQGLSDDQIAKKLGNEQLANQMKSESVQDRFAAATEKLQEIFVSIAEPILSIVSPLMDLVTTVLPAINFLLQPIKTTFEGVSKILSGDIESLSMWETILGSIGTIWLAIKGYAAFTALQTKLQALLEAKVALQKRAQSLLDLRGLALGKSKLVQLAAQAALWALANPFKALLGAAAAAGAFALGKQYLSKGDDVMSPGYGKRILSAPEGTFALNDKDTVVAGTDLDQGSNPSTSSPSINLGPLVEQMNKMNATLNAILSKEGTVMLDSTKVGTALTVGSYKLQ